MQHKKTFAAVVAGLLAVVAAITVFICVERVPVGYVGVVYSAAGVEDQTLSRVAPAVAAQEGEQFPHFTATDRLLGRPGRLRGERTR